MKLNQIKELSLKDTQSCLYLISKLRDTRDFESSLNDLFDSFKHTNNSFNISIFINKEHAKEHNTSLTFPYINDMGVYYNFYTQKFPDIPIQILEKNLIYDGVYHKTTHHSGINIHFIELDNIGSFVIQTPYKNIGFDNQKTVKFLFDQIAIRIVEKIKYAIVNPIDIRDINIQNPYPTLKLDNNGKLIYSNQVADPIKDHFQELNSVYAKLFQKCIENNETAIYEQVINQKYYSITIKPIPDKNIVNVFAMDISSRKNVENKLKEEKEKAEKSAQLKMEFLSTMSHEIRTPMNSIIGSINLLIDTHLDPYQSKKLEMMRFAADNLLRLINEILDLNKLEANKVSLEKIRFSLPDTIEHLFNMYADQAEQKNIGFHLETKNLPINFVEGDPTRLSQILLNLLSNAIKFTDKGEIALTVKKTFINDDIIVYQFNIKDSGIGISQDRIDTIFEAYTQAESSTTRKFGGTGLGLSITKKLVSLLEGQLKVESKENIGTTFKISIPFKISSDQNIIKKKDNLQIIDGNLKGKKVLIVDDNEFNIIIASEFLNRWEAEIEIAKNGQEAVDRVLFSEKDIDIILMDLQMPIMNGIEATKKIRDNEELYFKQIPIVALTADVANDEVKKIKSNGFHDIASKPFDPKSLLNKLISLIEKKDRIGS